MKVGLSQFESAWVHFAGEATVGLSCGACNSEVACSIHASGLSTHDSKAEYLIDIQDTTGRYRLGVSSPQRYINYSIAHYKTRP